MENALKMTAENGEKAKIIKDFDRKFEALLNVPPPKKDD
jgi:hypothetical protein